MARTAILFAAAKISFFRVTLFFTRVKLPEKVINSLFPEEENRHPFWKRL